MWDRGKYQLPEKVEAPSKPGLITMHTIKKVKRGKRKIRLPEKNRASAACISGDRTANITPLAV